jgi:hypothetical protein
VIYLIEMEGEIGEYGEDGYFVELTKKELAEVKKVLNKALKDGHLEKYNISDLSDRTNSKKDFLEVLKDSWSDCDGRLCKRTSQ